MNCSKCNSSDGTKVLSTRSADKPGRGAEVNKVANVVGWYTNDFIGRRRRCKACGATMMTVELSLEDVTEMIREASEGHASIVKR
jgi:transcriptional regulator NrdR family protein|tara:strand:+ start:1391 stop:1645 length:255 start_codon:yes stop_codon:yes gene_type:complete